MLTIIFNQKVKPDIFIYIKYMCIRVNTSVCVKKYMCQNYIHSFELMEKI